MLDYSLTYDQMKRYARMIILRSGMFNFTPPIFAGYVVNGGIMGNRNA